MYFTPEFFFIRLLSQVFIRYAPDISEEGEHRNKSKKVTKVTIKANMIWFVTIQKCS